MYFDLTVGLDQFSINLDRSRFSAFNHEVSEPSGQHLRQDVKRAIEQAAEVREQDWNVLPQEDYQLEKAICWVRLRSDFGAAAVLREIRNGAHHGIGVNHGRGLVCPDGHRLRTILEKFLNSSKDIGEDAANPETCKGADYGGVPRDATGNHKGTTVDDAHIDGLHLSLRQRAYGGSEGQRHAKMPSKSVPTSDWNRSKCYLLSKERLGDGAHRAIPASHQNDGDAGVHGPFYLSYGILCVVGKLIADIRAGTFPVLLQGPSNSCKRPSPSGARIDDDENAHRRDVNHGRGILSLLGGLRKVTELHSHWRGYPDGSTLGGCESGATYGNVGERFMTEPVRIMPCLDMRNGRVVKGVRFVDIRDAGDPVECARTYCAEGADEIGLLDITATVEQRPTLLDAVRAVAEVTTVPFLVGGGIGSVDAARSVLEAGADRISVSSAAFRSPDLIRDLVREFGADRVVVAIDVGQNASLPSGYEVFIDGGRTPTGMDAVEWAQRVEQLGVRTLLPTSKSTDGVRQGYDLPLLRRLRKAVRATLVASGGAGALEHFSEAVDAGATVLLAASVFHFGIIRIPALKAYLASRGVPVLSGLRR